MARITLGEFADFCGTTIKTATELRAAGIIPPTAEEMVDLVRPYVIHLREQAAGRASSGEFELTAERARLAHHQANLASLDEETKRKNLIPAEQVRAGLIELFSAFRAKMLSMPTRLAGSCAGKDAFEVEAFSRELINQALDELAKGDGIV
jgi:phage terminase Nu1 subunit (DNA packaging protein)